MPPKKASVRKLQKSIPKESVVAKRKIHNSKDTDEIPNSEVNETADSLLNGKIETMSAEESNNLSTEESKVAEVISNKRGRKRAQKEIITENSLEEGKTDSEPVSKRGKKYQNIQLSDLEDDPVKIIRADSKPISKGRKEINSTAEPVDFKKSKQNERKTTKETESNSGEAIENVKIPGRRGKNVKNKNTTDESVNDKPSVDLEVANAELSENKTDKGNKKQKVSRKGKSDETLVLNKDIESGEKPGQSKNKKKDVKSDDPIENVQAADTQKINADKKSPKRGKKQNAAEKNVGSDVKNENRILKVSLTRDEEIEKLVPISAEKVKKLNETVKGEESTKTKGKRGRSKNTQSSEDGAKLSKVPKKTDSKGQSKKDKMPDVTLLDFNNNSTSASGKKWNLKLSSWNVNGIRAWLEKDGLAFIKHESPDIMCVQETKCSENKLPEEVNVEGYHSYWLAGDQEGYSGVGLLSKEKPLSVKYGIDVKEHDNEGRVITAEYEKFFLVNTYIPNAGRKLVRLDYRMQWDKDFCLYLKKLDSQKPVILCGDLNVAHEEIDLANPKTNKKNAGFTQEERDGFSALLREGFVDTFRHLNPDKKGAYTFWTYMMNARAKDVGWRLDYFVMSKRFVEDHLCDNVMRKEVMGSDHCPITLFLTI